MRPIDKKGISPLIATVLLVGLVVIVGLLFFLFAKKQIAAQTEKIECGAQEQFNVDLSATCGDGDEEGSTLVTVSNIGQQTLDGIRIICTPLTGPSESPAATLINCKTGEECPVTYNLDLDCDQVEVLPGIVKEEGDNTKFVLCSDKSVVVQCVEG